MNWLDIGLLVALFIFLIWGLKKGLIKGVFSLAGVVVGVVLAGQFCTAFSESTMGKIITAVVIFIAVCAVAAVIASWVEKALKLVMLGWLDRFGGAVFGIVVGGVVLGAALAAYINFIGAEALISESKVAAMLLDKFPLVLALLPGEFGDTVRPFFE
jgi:membrane protein required for colicin V production